MTEPQVYLFPFSTNPNRASRHPHRTSTHSNPFFPDSETRQQTSKSFYSFNYIWLLSSTSLDP